MGHGTYQIDARHQGEFTDHRAFPGNGQAIFKVEGAVVHINGDILRGQLIFTQLLFGAAVTCVVFFNQ